MRPPLRVFALAAGLAGGLLLPAAAQDEARGGLELQKAHFEHVAARGQQAFYTRRWDLSDLPAYVPESHPAGEIREWGSNYIEQSKLGGYWEEGFRAFQPQLKFVHDPRGRTTLTAMTGLVAGAADLCPSRHLTFDDTMQFERVFNREPLEITAVTGSFNVPGWNYAIGIFVNHENPIARLTLGQLDGIFGAARDGAYVGTVWHPELARGTDQDLRTWGQLGLAGEWANRPIHVYGYNLRYHIPRTFERLVFHGGDKWNEGLHEYANYTDAQGKSHLEALQTMQAVERDPEGICYSTIAYLTPKTKALALAASDHSPYIGLNIETVRARTYPLFDEIYFYLDREPGKPLDPKVREYLRFILSREGQEAVERDGKYLPLTGEVVREMRARLN